MLLVEIRRYVCVAGVRLVILKFYDKKSFCVTFAGF